MKVNLTLQKYDSEISNEQNKLDKMLDQALVEKSELKRISDKLQVTKVKSRNVNKIKQGADEGIRSRKKRVLYKLDEIKKNKKLQQAKLKKLNDTILKSRKIIRKLELEKREYLRARKNFEKKWVDTIKSNNYYLDMIDLHNYDTLGVHIRAARAMLNMSKIDFSNLLDISSNQLGNLERPKKNIEVDKKYIKRIYKKLELTGIQIIHHGLHVSAGGPGVRLKHDKNPIETKKDDAKNKVASASIKNTRKKNRSDKKPLKVA